MSLPHAILTALLEKPSSGLELTRRFDKSIGYFWSATHQQIYRELGRLEREGYIRALPAPTARARPEEGVRGPARGPRRTGPLDRRGQDPKPLRDPLLLRLRAAAVVGTDGIEADLRRHLDLHRRQLAEYEEIEKRDFPPGLDAVEDRLQHVVLRRGHRPGDVLDALADARAGGVRTVARGGPGVLTGRVSGGRRRPGRPVETGVRAIEIGVPDRRPAHSRCGWRVGAGPRPWPRLPPPRGRRPPRRWRRRSPSYRRPYRP